jgi:hypothetical protein
MNEFLLLAVIIVYLRCALSGMSDKVDWFGRQWSILAFMPGAAAAIFQIISTNSY